jgi:hypothetical protein
MTICARELDDKASVKVWSKSLVKCRRSCAQKQLFFAARLHNQFFPSENLVNQSAAALNATDMQPERHYGFFLEKKTTQKI